MKLVLDSHVSQDFWRLVYPCSRSPMPAPYIETCFEVAARAVDVLQLAPRWLTNDFLSRGAQTIDVMAFGIENRRDSKHHKVRIWTDSIPHGSFYDLGNDVLVLSPCFTFLRCASELSLIELIAYGAEICGLYSFDAASPRGMRQRDYPLVSLAQLRAYVESAKGCQGCRKALRALDYIVENSASPMETFDELCLCLPYRYGGYGLRVPLMNYEIPVKVEAMRLAGRSTCVADLFWKDAHLIVEHQGDFDHGFAPSFASDRGRIDALSGMGYEVLELTWRQTSDLLAFEAIAKTVAKRLRKQLKKQYLGPTQQRLKLRSELMAWNHRYGHPRG